MFTSCVDRSIEECTCTRSRARVDVHGTRTGSMLGSPRRLTPCACSRCDTKLSLFVNKEAVPHKRYFHLR